jgi:hypothetical protein
MESLQRAWKAMVKAYSSETTRVEIYLISLSSQIPISQMTATVTTGIVMWRPLIYPIRMSLLPHGGRLSNDLAFYTYPARRAMAQKPTTTKVNQMMPKRFHMQTNK